jgi:uncharacterized membrane protein
MTTGLRVVLLLFALVGYLGAGAALAAARYRRLAENERDVGMFGVALMLFFFGALCTMVGVGVLGVAAVGAVVLWASYAVMAQHLGMFQVEVSRLRQTEEQEPEELRRGK